MPAQGATAAYFATGQHHRQAEVDAAQLRAAFGRLPAGVVVITSTCPCGELAGATVSSFTSLSFDPPLVCFGLTRHSKTLSAILGHSHFAVHVVGEQPQQQQLAMRFAGDRADKFSTVVYELSPYGVPLLPVFQTVLQCVLERAQPAGDHQLLIARVLDVALSDEEPSPVVWFQRGFRLCQPPVDA